MKSIFLSWNRPACPSVAERLSGMDDSSSCLVLVPTRESARQLRQEIAISSVKKAAFAPKILPIGSFLTPENAESTASPLAELNAWMNVLQSTKSDQYPTLFPQGLRDDPEFLLDIAEQMAGLRGKLAQEGTSFETISLQSDEGERWRELDHLNLRFASEIKRMGLIDSAAALWKEAAAPHLAAALQGTPQARIIIACIPELLRPVRQALLASEEMGISVELWVHAPGELADQFDSWGRPLSSFWSTCRIAIDENRMTIAGNPALLARSVCRQIAAIPPQESLALGVCDPRMTTPLEAELSSHGWGLYKPEGRPFSGTGFMSILRSLETSLDQPQLATPLADLLHSPLLASSLGIEQHYNSCVTLDHIRETWLPESSDYVADILSSKEIERQKQAGGHSPARLAQLKHECENLSLAWKKITAWRDSFLQNGQVGEKLTEWLRQVPVNNETGDNSLDSLLESVLELSDTENQNDAPLSPSFALRLMARQLQKTAVHKRRTERDTLDALGWLELSFCPEQHLIITGLSEGIVPEGKFGDQFLPESLKTDLNLGSMLDKTARDSFLLASLIESRKARGSVSIVISKTTPQNDPLLPSSLLMRCSDGELAHRVHLLFGQQATETPTTPYERGKWFITPRSGWGKRTGTAAELIPGFINPWENGGKAFSPSTLKRFLACPLRFWIQSSLKLNDSDSLHTNRRNMLPAESGTLMHQVLEAFAKQYPVDHPSLNEESLKREISHILDDEFHKRFSDDVLMPLSIQKAALEQRLAEYATLHLADLRDGWECLEFEKQVQDWTLAGFPMNFRIDRIDRHQDGRIRVVDYKTGKTESCEKSHLRILSDEAIEKLPLFAPGITPCPSLFNRKFRPHRWTDLQLPIYVLWASESFNTEASASYYAIPSNKREIKRYDWFTLHDTPEESSLSTIESAREWASAAMKLLQNGRCTLSAEELGWGEPLYDLFSNLRVEETIQQLFGIS